MKKKILISTGGSGGHVVPGTIFYDHLKYEFEMSMSSDYRGVKFLDVIKYNVKTLNVPKMSKNIFFAPIHFFLIIYSILDSIIFLKRKKIEILISTGGYMSLPWCLAAKVLNIRLFLFEPNMVLGRSNKFFISYCEKIFCYSDNVRNLPIEQKDKISLISPLLRKKFYEINNNKSTSTEINLLIIGGSQGAKLFDTIIKNSVISLSKRYKLKILQQTNKNNFNSLKNFYQKNKINNELFDFDENIYNFMKKATICLTRAGASTLAELVFLNVPHITIPLPTSKDNHQHENAVFYNQEGCNWILKQNEMNDDILINKFISIMDNKEEYQKKKLNMKKFNYENTWNNINQKIISTINEN